MSLKEWIKESNNIVFFGGAGVSTESNIPDFRSDNGLYKKQYPYPAEVMLSHSFYESNPKEFFEFYLLHPRLNRVSTQHIGCFVHNHKCDTPKSRLANPPR